MQRYLAQRLVQAIVTLLMMSAVVFLLARLTGNPVDLMVDMYATEQDRAELARHLGLDRPLPVQYATFVVNAARGDFGDSIRMRRPAIGIVMERFPATLQLAGVAMAVAIVIALPIGVVSAVRRDTPLDRFGKLIALLGQSMPVFWLGLVLMLVFAVWLRLLPTSGSDSPLHFILPGVTLGWYVVAGIMRLTRSSMLDVLDSEFVKLARIKGLPERIIVWKHCLKNAAIPVITFSGIIFVGMLTGSIVTETIFAWPGVGRLAYQAVLWRDFPLIQTIVILFTTVYVLVNLAIDLAYAYLDPRIRFS